MFHIYVADVLSRCCKHRRTGDANDATTEWDAEIWPLFLVLNNYGGCDLCSFLIKRNSSVCFLCLSPLYILTHVLCFRNRAAGMC
jgi:hypothetical protein